MTAGGLETPGQETSGEHVPVHGSTQSSAWNFYVPFQEPTTQPSTSPVPDDVEQPIWEKPNNKSDPSSKHNEPATPKTTLRQQWKTFLALSIPYFRESPEGRCLFLGLILLMLLDSTVRVAFSYLARDFWSALGDKDVDKFYLIMKEFLVALLFLAPVNVFYRFQRQRLAIKWRKWMTNRILHLYFYNSNQVYYSLERTTNVSITSEVVDNPDQRISEDVRSFTQYSLSLFLTLAVSLIDLSAFSVILYTIEPQLFFSIIGFATTGTVATVLVGRQLVQLNFERLQKEADFRFSLVRLRENAESIAFFRGESTEGKEISKRFTRVISNAYDIIGTQRNLEFFTASYNYLTWVLPVIVIAPQYIAGNVELGVVQQAAAAFGHVLDDLSLIINEFEGLSQFSASIGRLHQFVRAVQDADPDRDESSPLLGQPPGDDYGNGKGRFAKDGIFKSSNTDEDGLKHDKTSPLSASNVPKFTGDNQIQLSPVNSNSHPFALAIRNLRLETPDHHRTLIHSLSLELKWGQRLLIIGSSGIGKSSLLRAIAGLWSSGSGVIERASSDEVYFLPQRPYCPLGSLRDQLLYPFNTSNDETISEDQYVPGSEKVTTMATISDSKLLDILKAVDLCDLASRVGEGDEFAGLDVTMDWGNTLSLGEQQRLAFGRVLVHNPKLVICDEATSAMDVSAEERMYALIQKMTIVSVGHRPTLLSYHDVRLHLHKSTDKDYCECSVDAIHSTHQAVSKEEVNLFFR
jgi:ABC-type uncharacterized transport system fused permease/ATPase subunit